MLKILFKNECYVCLYKIYVFPTFSIPNKNERVLISTQHYVNILQEYLPEKKLIYLQQ